MNDGRSPRNAKPVYGTDMDDEMIEDEFEFEPDPADAACEFIEPGASAECGADGLIYRVASVRGRQGSGLLCPKHLLWVHAGGPEDTLGFTAFNTAAEPA